MFSPIAVDNIAFPQRTSLASLDAIPESFEAYQAYSNMPTASTYTTQSVLTSQTSILRCGINDAGKILCIPEGGGTTFIWDTVTETSSSAGSITPGTTRNVLWDSVTNSWVVCGTNSFTKVNCDTLATTAINVPTNQGTQYAAVSVTGGKAYALPLSSTGTNTAVAIFDLVANTATTASAPVGISSTTGFWSACVTTLGTIYFGRETSTTNQSIYEFNPQTNTGTLFGTLSANAAYGMMNLTNGNVFIPGLGVNGSVYIVNPSNKSIQTIATAGFGYQTGICLGQNGHPYGIRSASSGITGIWGFNPTTNTGYLTQYAVPAATSGDRGYQDFFSLADGRLIAMPGQNNSGRLTYWTYLQNPRNNTFPLIGPANPIVANGKGT